MTSQLSWAYDETVTMTAAVNRAEARRHEPKYWHRDDTIEARAELRCVLSDFTKRFAV
jgi:hypothetical protein